MTRTFLTSPSRRIHATFWPLRSSPWWMRSSASRPRNGDASRLVTWAWSGAPSTYVGAGIVSRIVRNSGSRSGESGMPPFSGFVEGGAAGLGRGVDDREVERVLAVALVEEVEEQLVGLVDDLGDPGVGAVDLVDHEHDRHVGVERLAQHEPGLGQRALARVDQQHDPVDHRQPALDLAAEVGVAGGVDDVDRHPALGRGRSDVVHRGVLREDRDALLALEVTGVHHPVDDGLGLVHGERPGLAQHGVDQRGLAVVDVGDDRDVAQRGVEELRHEGRLYARCRAPARIVVGAVRPESVPLRSCFLPPYLLRELARQLPDEAARLEKILAHDEALRLRRALAGCVRSVRWWPRGPGLGGAHRRERARPPGRGGAPRGGARVR